MKIKDIFEEAGVQYKSLNDAGKEYAPGKTQIWYSKDEITREFLMGYKFAMKQGVFNPNDIKETHVLVGTLAEANPEKIWSLMQAENWSPAGEARSMIIRLGTGHTSMSVGDIIVVDNRGLMVDRMGFVDITTGEEL